MVDLTEFFSLQIGMLRQTPKKYRRFLYEKINWESRLIGIVSGRGTGKTTILLQHLNAEKKAGVDILYISADHIRVEALGLYEIGAAFFKTGGQVLAIDEIHKYNNWAQEVKNLYDSFPKSRRQIKEHEHSFVVKDDIETGFGNIIPLWLFGFMY